MNALLGKNTNWLRQKLCSPKPLPTWTHGNGIDMSLKYSSNTIQVVQEIKGPIPLVQGTMVFSRTMWDRRRQRETEMSMMIRDFLTG